MKIVFANSSHVSAPERFVVRAGRWTRVSLKVRYGFIDHPQLGPMLIDTGYGPQVTTARSRSAALRLYARVLNPQLVDDEQPETLLAHYGYECADVRFVIITHFHADHVSHLSAFPNAHFIANTQAWRTINRRSHMGNVAHGVFTELLPQDIEARLVCTGRSDPVPAPLTLSDGADLLGDGSVLAIDLPGHADGQFGLCFAKLDVPLLYGVDVEWHNAALLANRSPGKPASLIAHDNKAARASAAAVRRFKEAGGEILLCHDPSDSRFDYRAGAR